MGHVIGRTTALCLAVKAAWAMFFGVYDMTLGMSVNEGDDLHLDYTIEVRRGLKGWFVCRVS